MLTTRLTANALAVANQLKDSSIILQPSDNSILSELVEASLPVCGEVNQEVNVYVEPGQNFHSPNAGYCGDTFEENVELVTGHKTTESIHTLKIRSIADDLAPLILSHVSHARNTVVPLINKFEDDAYHFLDLAKTIDPANEFKLVIVRIPKLLADESFNARGLNDIVILSEVKEQDLPRPLVVLNDIDAVVASIKNQGSDRLNGLVEEWLAGAPEDIIKRVLVTNFSSVMSAEDNAKDFYGNPSKSYGVNEFYRDYSFSQYGLRRGGRYAALNISLATYIVAKWLRDNVQSTSNNISLEAYQAYFDYIADLAGVTLKHTLKLIRSDVQSNLLVSLISPSTKTIHVIEPVFADYLNEGGKTEALFGMLVTNKSSFDKRVVLEKQVEFISDWNVYLSYRKTKDLSDIRTNFQGWVIAYMQASLNELTQGEQDCLKEMPNLKDQIMAKVREQIEYLSHSLHENIPHTALHMVAKARFFYTSAYSILSEMQQATTFNKDIDPREAATLSVINYVVDFFDLQIELANKLK